MVSACVYSVHVYIVPTLVHVYTAVHVHVHTAVHVHVHTAVHVHVHCIFIYMYMYMCINFPRVYF